MIIHRLFHSHGQCLVVGNMYTFHILTSPQAHVSDNSPSHSEPHSHYQWRVRCPRSTNLWLASEGARLLPNKQLPTLFIRTKKPQLPVHLHHQSVCLSNSRGQKASSQSRVESPTLWAGGQAVLCSTCPLST